jgi:protein TonB
MLQQLLESRARPARRRGGTALSVLAHAAAVGAAVAATGRAAPPPAPPERAGLVYVAPRPTRRRPPPPAAPPAAAPARSRPGGAPAAPRSRVRPIIGFTLPALRAPVVDVVTGGPAPTATRADDFAPGGLAAPDGRGRDAGALGSAHPADAVDEPVVPDPRNPPPRYPEALRAAGVGGRVVARFVVDTLGRVEAGSVAFPAADDPRLAGAARDALARARFRPARAGGRRVRQLVEQPFAFSAAGRP